MERSLGLVMTGSDEILSLSVKYALFCFYELVMFEDVKADIEY